MRKILGIVAAALAMLLSSGSAYAVDLTATQAVTITSTRHLTLTPPGAVAWTIGTPLIAGTEVIAAVNTVILEGNQFTNAVPALPALPDPFITVAMTGTVTNADVILTGIGHLVSEVGVAPAATATLAIAPGDITLAVAAANYAVPDVTQVSTVGKITGTHGMSLLIHNIIPVGVYTLTITWTGHDGL